MIGDTENLVGSFPMMSKAADSKNNSNSSIPQAKSKSSGFVRLLKDVTNEIRMDQDEKLANQAQYNEAQEIASEWMREERDRQAAAKLSKELELEMKASKAHELELGEKAALKVAMEERRHIQAEAQAKREVEVKDIEYAKRVQCEDAESHAQAKNDFEAKDVEFAKRVVIIDVEEEFALKESYAEDEKIAKRLQAMLQDEIYAEEVLEAERQSVQEKLKYIQDLSEADERLAKEMNDLFHQEQELNRARQEESDLECARNVQKSLDLQNKKAALLQEQKDALLSRKLQIKQQRQDHRELKIQDVLPISIAFSTTAAIAKQWEECEASCEDVANAICLTLLLPHLFNLKVSVAGNTIIIEASRQPKEGDRHANKSNSRYLAEFKIEGIESVKILETDLSYEYSSTTGLLFVYVDRVQLDADFEAPKGGVVGKLKQTLSGLAKALLTSAEAK